MGIQKSDIHDGAARVRIVASEKSWIEGNAIQQLEITAKLRGITLAVGLPDLHAGNGYPVGAAFVSKGWVYPALVGNDIGCGMGLWQTQLNSKTIKRNKWAAALDLDGPWSGDKSGWLIRHGLPSHLCATAIGTIGGGNHFAELQSVHEVVDSKRFEALGIDKNSLYLLVHSGSRGLGELILRQHVDEYGHQGLDASSEKAHEYFICHDQAVHWAEANRKLIAKRFCSALKTEGRKVLDVNHNTLTTTRAGTEDAFIHRKGASPSDCGTLVIPGSRGSASYLVQPKGDQSGNAFSLAHGAGRKWRRSDVKARLAKKYKAEDFKKTDLGSLVICESKALLYEEAPQAYKKIDQVILDMVNAGLIDVIAILHPVITYKTRRMR